MPTFSTRSIDFSETAKSRNNANPDPEAGKITFMSHCNHCHDLPDPSKYTAKQLETILPIMTRRARLTKEEASNVTIYLKEHSSISFISL